MLPSLEDERGEKLRIECVRSMWICLPLVDVIAQVCNDGDKDDSASWESKALGLFDFSLLRSRLVLVPRSWCAIWIGIKCWIGVAACIVTGVIEERE